MKRYIKGDKIKFLNEIVIRIDGVQIINPVEALVLADGWQEYLPPSAEPKPPTYEELVAQFIRARYSANEEFAIQRQRETKPTEFAEYFAFCEECKANAKNEITDKLI
ncbi:MAG: hypothetical protein IKA41_06385 [Bacteroidaceae bacterium]|nr:hypothetical protein [Bacteroidaceae bacterium]